MLLYLFIPLFLATCSPLSAPAPIAPESIIVVGNTTVTHTPTTSFTRLRKPIKPAAEEITWLKSQTEKPSPTKLAKPKKTIIQTQLVTALKQQKAQRLLIEAEHAADSFSLRIQVLKGNKTTCTVQTLHPTCPAWVKMVVKQSLEQVVVDAKRRQREILGGCAVIATGICAVAYKNHVDAENARQAMARRAQEEQAAETKRQAIEKSTNAAATQPESILTRYEKNPTRTSTDATLRQYKTLLTTTPFFNFVVGKATFQLPIQTGFTLPLDEKEMRQLCNAYPSAYLEDDEFTLTPEQYNEFLNGCFKETTIDFLAQFERNFLEGKRQDITYANKTGMPSSFVTNNKEIALKDFRDRLTALQTEDPIEAKRILCLHPDRVESVLYGYNSTTNTGPEPRDDYPNRFPCFGSILRHSLAGNYCLKDSFPYHISIFCNLHTVSATA